MKIEKLTENKIRIIVDIDELNKRNINLHTFDKNDVYAQKLFSDILENAKNEIGFLVEDSKLLIEAFTSNENFVILTFTKINTLKSSNAIIKKRIFKFNSFDDFCNFCICINSLINCKNISKNMILYEYNSFYYLLIPNIKFEKSTVFYSFITEFSKKSSSSVLEYKLSEYGNIIFENYAIKKCIKYFL